MSQTPCLGLRRSATANVESLYQSWETVSRTGVKERADLHSLLARGIRAEEQKDGR